MNKNVLILCCGYPFARDLGFGYHIAKELGTMKLSENVEVMDVGLSASMIPNYIDGRDKLIVVDVFRIKKEPGTVVRLKPEEVPITVDGITDPDKYHLMETLEDIKLTGKCPETVFIGVIPKDTVSDSEELTPVVKKKIPEVIKAILEEVSSV